MPVDVELLLFAVPSAILCAAACTALALAISERRRIAVLRARANAHDGPAMVTSFEGTVLHANGAMAAAGIRPGARAEVGLARLFEGADGALVYRLSYAARRTGFALRAGRGPCGARKRLTAMAGPAGCVLWSLACTARSDRGVSLPDALPLAARCAGGNWYTNDAFAARVAISPDRLAARLTPAGQAVPGAAAMPATVALALETPAGGAADWVATVEHGPDGAPTRIVLLPHPCAADTEAARRALLRTVPVAMAEFAADGALLGMNRLAHALMGPEAVPGRRFEELFSSATPGTDLAAAIPAGGDREPRSRMAQLRASGAFLQLAISRTGEGEAERLIVVLTDASQLRQLEDQFTQSQKMEAVGKLAGGVAHDFNNVLTAIVGHCDLLLLRKEASHPDYSDLMQIAQNANRAAALVRQLLAFSRKQTLNPEILSVQDVITETHYLLGRLVGETIALRLEIGPDLWPVRADHQQLEQVLMNLVVNARDAMDGSGTITVSLANRAICDGGVAPPGDFVEIRVCDTGPGLARDVIDKVFDPFFTTKAKGEGTGLGLSTVYGIIKQSGGHIDASNGPEGGAVFRILLPRAEERTDAPPRRTPEPVRRDLTGKGSVLLVEDEDPVRAFAARALRLRGYEVFEAATAEDAMDLLSGEAAGVDLLVSDVVMPGMDGPTFAAKARQLVPGLRLVFVSGYAEESFRNNLTDTDFHFLPKPFSLNELTAKVKEAMGERVSA